MEISKDTLVTYHHIKRETQLTYHRYLTTNCNCCPMRPDAKLTFPDERPLEELLTSAERDRNAEAAVEAAVRYALLRLAPSPILTSRRSIIADQGDNQRMIHILWTTFDPDARPRRMSRTTRGHGLSLLAWIYLESHRMFKDEDEDKETSDAALRYAQMFAESCAQIDFVSQVVLNVGAATVATANRRAFATYPHLRAAYEDYLKQLSRKGCPVLDNFACTAGCGVYASKLAGLRRCTGACPPTHKAYYCTKECQKIVRELIVGSVCSLTLPCRTGRATSLSAAPTRPPQTSRRSHLHFTLRKRTTGCAVPPRPVARTRILPSWEE